MEFILVIAFILLVLFFNSSVFYSRKDWEREMEKYDTEEEQYKIYNLPTPIKFGAPSLQNISNKVCALSNKILEKTSNIMVKVPETVKYIKKIFNIFEKIDEKAKEIKINTKFGMVALIFWLCIICCTAHIIKDFINFIKEMSFYNVLDIIIAISTICLLVIVIYFLIRDIGGIISLKRTEDTKAKISNLIKTSNTKELKKYLLSLDLAKADEKELKAEFKDKKDPLEVAICYEKIVLKKYDEKVHKIICEYRNKVIIGNGISGSSMLDFAVNLYCFYQILRNVAKIYHVKLGLISIFRVLGAGCLICYAVSKTTNLLGKASNQILEGVAIAQGLSLLSLPFKALIQAITSGLSMQIYGYWLKYALRPIKPYNQSMKEKTTQVLKYSSSNDEE